MVEVRLPSPAKINLFLHVVGRRPDGYHLLQTAFQFIDLCDDMVFQLRTDDKILVESSDPTIPYESNLVTKAAYLLKKQTGCRLGIDIKLEKCIPRGGGLGGGSSNAATTLLALNLLWGTQLNPIELAALGLELGADVPIFIHGKAAFAQGIGEQLTNIHPEEKWILLLLPDCTVDTSKIFSDPELTRNTPEITITEYFEGTHNDCEPVARKRFPQIATALDWLNEIAAARMTGTGSGVFAIFNDKEAAMKAAKEIPASLKGITVKGLNNSPLHNAIENIGVSPSGKARGFDLRIPRFES